MNRKSLINRKKSLVDKKNSLNDENKFKEYINGNMELISNSKNYTSGFCVKYNEYFLEKSIAKKGVDGGVSRDNDEYNFRIFIKKDDDSSNGFDIYIDQLYNIVYERWWWVTDLPECSIKRESTPDIMGFKIELSNTFKKVIDKYFSEFDSSVINKKCKICNKSYIYHIYDSDSDYSMRDYCSISCSKYYLGLWEAANNEKTYDSEWDKHVDLCFNHQKYLKKKECLL